MHPLVTIDEIRSAAERIGDVTPAEVLTKAIENFENKQSTA